MGELRLLGTKLRSKKSKGVSTYIAVLLLIMLAIIVGLIIWAYTMGYLGIMGLNPKNNAMQIQSVTIGNNQLQIYLKNTGNGPIKLTPGGNSKVYINDIVKTYQINEVDYGPSLPEGKTCTIAIATSDLDPEKSGLTSTIKIIAEDGTTTTGQFKLSYINGYQTTTTLNAISTPLQAAQTGIAFSGSVTASLAIPDGAPVTLQYSASPSGPWTTAASASTTGGNGAFSGTFPTPAAGTYYFQASFAQYISGTNVYTASESAQQAIVTIAGTVYPTTTTLNAIPTPLQAGQANIAFSGQVSSSTVISDSATVAFQYSTSPSGPWSTAATALTSGGAGAYAGTFTAPTSGTYYLQAYFEGYVSGSVGWSSSASTQQMIVTVTGSTYPTTTTLNTLTTPLQAGTASVAFSGTVSASTMVPNGASVKLQYSASTSGPWTDAASASTSGGNGAFSGTFTAPAAGTYYYRARFGGNSYGISTWSPSTSAQQMVITVSGTVYPTTTTLNAITTPLQGGIAGVAFSGTVSASTAVPNGAPITLQYSTSPSGPWTTAASASTIGGNGAFSGTFTAPSAVGTYYYQAYFGGAVSGSNGWSSSTSATQTILVNIAGSAYTTSTTLNSVSTPLQVGQTGVAFSGSVTGSIIVLNGATVTLQYSASPSGPWTDAASASTSGGNGAFSGTFTAPASAATYYFQAYFAIYTSGSNTWSSSSSAQQTVVVVSGTVYSTTTTLNAITTPLQGGTAGVAFSGTVSASTAVPNGASVTLQYSTSTSGPWSTAATATTSGGNGAYSGTFTAPAAGTYYYRASFGGYVSGVNGWSSSVSSQQTIVIVAGGIISTTITLNQLSTPLQTGQTSVSFSGQVTAGTAVPDGVTMVLQYSVSPSGPWSTAATISTTGGNGAFSGTFTAPSSAATYYFQAYFSGYSSETNNWSSSVSAQQAIVVSSGTIHLTTTSLNALTTPLQAGATGIAFSGSVTSETAVPNSAPVVLQYSASPSGPWTLAASVTTTGGNGAFSGTFTAPSAGTYYFQAYFASYASGGSTWSSSTSVTQSIVTISGTINPTTTTLNTLPSPLQTGTTNIPFSGTVSANTAVPNGASVTLQYSTSTSGPWSTAATATTSGGSGAYSGTFTAPAAGTYYFRTSFGGYISASNAWSSSVSAQQTIITITGVVITTSTTLNTITTPLQAGAANVAFSGTVSASTAVPNNAPMVLQYSISPSGPWTTMATAQTTGGAGAFSGTFTAPAAGTYYFQAYFASYASGGNTWSSSTSPQQTVVTVTGAIYSTTTTLNPISSPLQTGAVNVPFSGQVIASTAVPNGAQVILRYSISSSGPWTTAATVSTTGGNGAFSGTFTASASASTYYFQAYFGGYTSGTNGWSSSASAQQAIVVSSGTIYTTITTLNALATPLQAGAANVAFSGTVSASTAVPNNAPMVLQYSISPSGPWTTMATAQTTGGAGAYAGTFTAPAANTYYFRASFASFASGASTWSSSTSDQQSILIVSGAIYTTTTTLSALPTPIGTSQANVPFSGQVTASTSVPNGAPVILRYSTSPSGPWTTAATVSTTGGNGAFSGTFTAPASAATYYYQAYFAVYTSGTNAWSTSPSAQQTIVVSSGAVYVTATTLNALVTPLQASQTGAAYSGSVAANIAVPNGAPVLLQYSLSPSGPWINVATTPTTGGTGAFSGTFTVPSTLGTYYFQAYFAAYTSGSNTWSSSTSPMRTVIITQSTPLSTGFQGTPWDQYWDAWGNPPWRADPTGGYAGSIGATSDSSDDGPFSSNVLDTRSANTIYVSFKIRVSNTETTDLRVLYSYVSNPNSGPSSPDFYSLSNIGVPSGVAGAVSLGSGWYQITMTLPKTSYPNAFSQNFRLRFESVLTQTGGETEQVWLDDVVVALGP